MDNITLKEYMEKLIEQKYHVIDARLIAMDKALTKAERALESRLESVNEFRANLSDQTRTFVPRVEVEKELKTLKDGIEKAENRLNTVRDMKSGGNVVWAYVIAGIGAVGGVVALIMTLGG